MKKEDKLPIGTQIRTLETGQSVELPKQKIGAINAAINYLRLTYDREFTRRKKEDVITVTRTI